MLFSPGLKVNILLRNEVCPGRILIVRAEINNFNFLLVNIYAPTTGLERMHLFKKLEQIFGLHFE